jgi:transcriptional regulator with XRE-family HTH domain
MSRKVDFDGDKLHMDMVLKGWTPVELSRRAEVSDMTVYRYLSGQCRTAKTTKKLAQALGYPMRRYLIVPKRLRAA